MKNKLSDLNNHLFAQLEKLGDDDLNGEKLAQEIERSKAITDLSDKIIDNAKMTLQATKLVYDMSSKGMQTPDGLPAGSEEVKEMLGLKSNNN